MTLRRKFNGAKPYTEAWDAQIFSMHLGPGNLAARKRRKIVRKGKTGKRKKMPGNREMWRRESGAKLPGKEKPKGDGECLSVVGERRMRGEAVAEAAVDVIRVRMPE